MIITLISTTSGITTQAEVMLQTKCFAMVQPVGKSYYIKLSLRTGRLVDDEFTIINKADINRIKNNVSRLA